MHVTRHEFCLLIIKALCSRFVFLLGKLILCINVTPILLRTRREMAFSLDAWPCGVSSHHSVCTRSMLLRVLRCSIISLTITFIDIFFN